MTEVDPALAALPLWPDTVDAFYADRACSIRSDATRKTWGYTYRWIQRLHPDKPIIEINEPLYEGLAARGASLDDVAPHPDAARQLFDGMPSFDVAVTLKTAYHRDPLHRWTLNDIHDIDALGSTVPYADIVVTDKAVAHQLNVNGVASRCGITVISRLAELPALL